MRGRAMAIVLAVCSLEAQVYSPRVLKQGQPDTAELPALARGIFDQAGAHTPREKAEAIWRFFLTDGRFVKPGMIYHIAGWAYEEPGGEVLDPVKLLNSYGFGLCYHIAPLLEAVFKAGGFADARVWFLTGHTVAEVYYDGGYHYFDSDMMGYNPIGTSGALKQRPVASVHQIERDGTIITGKLRGPNEVADVDQPWYPADVRAHAIGDLAELFTSSKDNWVYPYQRYEAGHTMDFVLRPGERMVRYFHPEPDNLAYLPYRFDGVNWREFPREIAEYKIRTADGPGSQKDARRWATGVQQYRPAPTQALSAVYAMPCPYVIIDASVQMTAELRGPGDRISVETSVDDGRTWTEAGTLTGPHHGTWTAAAAVLTKSEHGSRNAVSGTYGYLARVSRTRGGEIGDLLLATRFQLNPRTLPELAAGLNPIEYFSTGTERWQLPARPLMSNAALVTSEGQAYWTNQGGGAGEIVFEVQAGDGGEISGFDAGGRFLDLRDGLAPDKFTAEVRKVEPWPAAGERQSASLAWAAAIDGPYQTLWTYNPRIDWKDGDPIDRTLRWPEVDRQVRNLAKGTRQVYVRYRLEGLGMDSPRVAAVREGMRAASPLEITHVWMENGARRERVERAGAGEARKNYDIEIPPGATVVNEALILEAKAPAEIASKFAAHDAALDWNPESGFWREIPPTVITTDNFGKPQAAHRTEVRSRWTRENLYFQFTCKYEELYLHPNPSRTVETNHLWDWDVAEAFVGSDFENIRRYREFEMSPQGEWVDLDIDLSRPKPAEGWTWNSGFEVKAAIDRKHKVWYGVMRIPYSSIDVRKAAAGNVLRVNFFREQGPPGRRVEIVWQPTMQRTYHVPERFGILKLTE